jgi:hypothetical protein
MKFYFATGIENIEVQRRGVRVLEAIGHKQSYDWTVHGDIGNDRELATRLIQDEMQGVYDADFVIVMLPGGRGTHTELGAAIMARKPVILLAQPDQLLLNGRVGAIYCHPLVQVYDGHVDNLRDIVGPAYM